MKKLKSLYFLTSLMALVLVALSSCTRLVSFNTLRPAPVTVPPHIKTVLIVDRTDYENKKKGIIEGIITGEGVNEDRNGALEAINSLQQTLLNSPRFNVKIASERLKGNTILGDFPEPLSFAKIEGMCAVYQADAVIALEIFDTNFIVTDGRRTTKKTIEQNGQKREIDAVEFYAQGVGSVKIGFRIYDPKEKLIADQQLFNKKNTWEAKASSIRDAVTGLIAKSEATREMGSLAGSDYAYKIAPMPVRITRTFYNRPKKNRFMASGARMADVGQWNDAIATWKEGIERSKFKTAGKLTYNIAVAHEVLGDLNMAKDWANKAYVNYGNKTARDYASSLNYRIRQENIVQEQMQ